MEDLAVETEVSKIRICDVLSVDELQRMQDVFALGTGVASLITAPDGCAITRPTNFCRLCNLVRSSEIGSQHCLNSDRNLAKNKFSDQTDRFTPCLSAGLWDSGAAIYIEDVHVANWYIGQVRTPDVDTAQIWLYADKLGFDRGEFEAAYREVPVIDSSRFIHIRRMLDFFANELSNKAYLLYKQKKEIAEKEKLHKEIREREVRYEGLLKNLNTAVIVHSPTGEVVLLNRKASVLLGVDPDEARGKTDVYFFQSITNPNGGKLSFDQYPVNQVIATKASILNKVYGVLRSDGRFVWVNLNAVAVCDAQAKLLEVVVSFDDITPIIEQSEQLKISEEKFRSYVEYAPHAVILADISGRILDANPAALRFLSADTSGLLSDHFFNLQMSESGLPVFPALIHAAKEHGYSNGKIRFQSCENEKYALVDIVKLSVEQYIIFMVDTTEAQLADVALKQNRELLLDSQRIAHVGSAVIDLTKNKWKSSALLNEILGLGDTDVCDFDLILDIIHPDWVNKVVDSFTTEVLFGKTDFDMKFKIIRQHDKHERWVHTIGKMKFDDREKVSYLIVTLQDITVSKEANDALRKSESLYRTTLNASPDAVMVLDLDGNIVMTSPSAVSLFGCESDLMIVGRNFFEFVSAEDKKRAELNCIHMQEGYIGTIEYMMEKPSGEIFIADLNGDVIYDRVKRPTGMVFIIRDITEKKNVEIALAKSRLQLRDFAAHLQSVREEERLALSREIHDDLGQILIAIKIELGLTKNLFTRTFDNSVSAVISPALENLIGLVDNTIQSSRRIMSGLRPDMLDILGFQDALKLYVKNFENRYKIECIFKCDETLIQLRPEYTVALYRIFQESLSNVVRHSKATLVEIRIVCIDSKLRFLIADNGIGFDPVIQNRVGSYGLLSIKERVFLMDGNLVIDSASGKGTKVEIEIPYNQTI